jgi:hypothetical protein
MADETRQIQVLMGPYRDNRLTVSATDAESAINNHWAVDPHELPDPDHQHPPLSAEERTAALEAAQTWAQQQWDTAQQVPPTEPPPVEPPITRSKSEKRDLKPDEQSGRGYATREKL